MAISLNSTFRFKQYRNTKERRKAMEEYLIMLTNLKSTNGKSIELPPLSPIVNIYEQAENELYNVTHQQS